VKSWLASFIARHIIADDPYPQLSHLDRMDGIK